MASPTTMMCGRAVRLRCIVRVLGVKLRKGETGIFPGQRVYAMSFLLNGCTAMILTRYLLRGEDDGEDDEQGTSSGPGWMSNSPGW